MKSFIQWLEKKMYVNIVFIIVYFLAVVLPHEIIGDFIVAIFRNHSREFYQNIVLFSGLLLLSFYTLFFFRKVRQNKQSVLIILYYLVTVAFIYLSFEFLLIHNIEIIHFIQYAFLSILIFPRAKGILKTIYWSTLLGVIDESYQYFFLASGKTNYFDFNDIILNLLGSAFGITLILVLNISFVTRSVKKWFLSSELISALLISIIVLLLFYFSVLSIYPPENDPDYIYALIKKAEPGFWSYIKHLNIKYHVIKPLEGIIIIFALFSIYCFFNIIISGKNDE